MDFTSGSNNHSSEATRVNWGIEELAQRSKRRKIYFNEENSKNKTKNILLFISGEDGIYHAENTTLLPHVSNQRQQEDTIYLPLKSCVFINLTSYDEIVVNKGTFFFGDEKGVYVNSCAGVAVNFLKHSSKEKRLYTARSFVFNNPSKAQEVYERLILT